ncbi:MAG: four helix bundle protein [Chloroflexi bacterium]|nr:MAG: four helix bundle protein [Chloroflexota bacterium]
MPTSLEDVRVLKSAEQVADAIYKVAHGWNDFAKDVVGKQIARAADSVGANIAESFGRYHFGEKIQFLYYARGSVFETKYWLNRASARELMSSADSQNYVTRLTDIARQLNLYISSLKGQRSGEITVAKTVKESPVEYLTSRSPDDFPDILFDETDIAWLESPPTPSIL